MQQIIQIFCIQHDGSSRQEDSGISTWDNHLSAFVLQRFLVPQPMCFITKYKSELRVLLHNELYKAVIYFSIAGFALLNSDLLVIDNSFHHRRLMFKIFNDGSNIFINGKVQRKLLTKLFLPFLL